MVHLFVYFQVKDGCLDEAKSVINEFIRNITENETETLDYASWQEKDNENKFVHTMTFKDEEARKHHVSTEYVKPFVAKLYPICVEDPKAIFMELFDGK